MLFNRRRYREERRGPASTLVNIATMVTTAVTCIRIAYLGIVSVEVAIVIMLGVVILVALGNDAAKIILAASALLLFVLLYSRGDKAQYTQLLSQMLAIILVLVGIYVMVRGFFRR